MKRHWFLFNDFSSMFLRHSISHNMHPLFQQALEIFSPQSINIKIFNEFHLKNPFSAKWSTSIKYTFIVSFICINKQFFGQNIFLLRYTALIKLKSINLFLLNKSIQMLCSHIIPVKCNAKPINIYVTLFPYPGLFITQLTDVSLRSAE